MDIKIYQDKIVIMRLTKKAYTDDYLMRLLCRKLNEIFGISDKRWKLVKRKEQLGNDKINVISSGANKDNKQTIIVFKQFQGYYKLYDAGEEVKFTVYWVDPKFLKRLILDNKSTQI